MADADRRVAAGPESAVRIYLVRHPETDWNRAGRYQSRTGRPFTDRGAASVEALVEYFHGRSPQRVVSSLAAHARGAADRIAAMAGSGDGAIVDDDWREIDHGAWEGLRHDEVLERFGAEVARRFDDPRRYDGHGGETLRAAAVRVARSWEALAGTAGDVVVVSHATPIRLVLCRCLGLPMERQWGFRIDNSSVTGVSIDGGTATIEFVNHRIQT